MVEISDTTHCAAATALKVLGPPRPVFWSPNPASSVLWEVYVEGSESQCTARHRNGRPTQIRAKWKVVRWDSTLWGDKYVA